ncbi:unnamed protein product [Brassica oleracea var. botrytis]
MDSSPPSGFEPGSMTIGPQDPYQTSYHILSFSMVCCISLSKFQIYVLADFKYVLDTLQILNQVYYMLLSM